MHSVVVRTFRASLYAVCLAAATGGCSPPDAASRLGVFGEEIIDGQVDTTDEAVVAILRNNPAHPDWSYLCSGTIVARSGTSAAVLTAAHCANAPPETAAKGDPGPTPSELLMIQGNDFASSNLVYLVTSFLVHPNYKKGVVGSPYDFAMMTIIGAGPQTPTLPFATPQNDPLVVGGKIEVVGYGRVTHPDGDGGPIDTNSVRHSLLRTVSDLEPLLVGHTGEGGALDCSGDSGGPNLATVAGRPTVVGVTSFGDGGCYSYGFAGRVSAVADWIQQYVDTFGTAAAPTCDECNVAATVGVGACTPQVGACRADAECSALWDCLDACSANDAACFRACDAAHPTGGTKYDAILNCVCAPQTCAAPCKGSLCGSACGIDFGADACGTCIDTNCCGENAACKADATCSTCFGANPSSACSSNTAFHALERCMLQSCNAPCGYGTCGVVGATLACTSCMESRCCAENQACAARPDCHDCAEGVRTVGCDAIPEYETEVDCVAKRCGAACNVSLPREAGAAGGGGSGASGSMSAGSNGIGEAGAAQNRVASDSGTSTAAAGDSGGCSCRTDGTSKGSPWRPALAALAFMVMVRRRQDRNRRT